MADYEWVGAVKAMMPEYVKKEEDATIRTRVAFRRLQQKGRITMNHGGNKCVWDVLRGELDVAGYTDGGELTFAPSDLLTQAEQNWRAYKVTEFLSQKQDLMANDNLMLSQSFKSKIPNMFQALRRQMACGLYDDGNATGYTDGIHGAKSWYYRAAQPDTTEIIAQPGDTFAGISTAVGQYDTWTTDLGVGNYPNEDIATDWPEGGTGNTAGYDFSSPKLYNWDSTKWSDAGLATWPGNCEYVLSRLQQHMMLTAGVDESDLFVILAPNLFNGFKNAERARQRNLMPHPDARDLGIPGDILNFDGLRITSEFGVTSNQFWAWNLAKVEICSLDKRLFHQIGPNWCDTRPGYLFQAGFMGNIKWGSPKFHAFGQNRAGYA